MDTSGFSYGAPIDGLPEYSKTIVSELGGGLLLAVGFTTTVPRLLTLPVSRPITWPCGVFAVTDGIDRSAIALIHDGQGSAFEVEFRMEGMHASRRLLRIAYGVALDLSLNGVLELWAFAAPGDVKARKNLRRLGFACVTDDATREELFSVPTSGFLSPKLRRRIQRGMN